MKNPIFYRISQFVGFLLGARVFVTALLTYALYVSTFFLFNQEEDLRNFVFDFKVHGIIFCSVLSILAGGIINQFYDREKDRLTKPFRARFQSFLKQKYFLYAYLILNLISLGIAFIISPRVFLFFLVYQFLMWFYSHKLSKILVVNNFTFVGLTLYPFFGMLVYYGTFSMKVFLLAVFLFLILLVLDVLKDLLTTKADRLFGYDTLPIFFGAKTAKIIIIFLFFTLMAVSCLIVSRTGFSGVLSYYFAAGLFVFILAVTMLLSAMRNRDFIVMNMLRIWIFIGITAMFLNGILTKF